MGFFSKFKKWMGAEDPAEKVAQPAAPAEKQPDTAEAAPDAVTQPSEATEAVDTSEVEKASAPAQSEEAVAEAADTAKDAASEEAFPEESTPAASEPAPEAVAAAPAEEEISPAAPASPDVAPFEVEEAPQAETVAEADVAAPAQSEEAVAEAADTAKDAASEEALPEESAPAASEPAPEAVAAAPAEEEISPVAPAASDVASSEAAEAPQTEPVAVPVSPATPEKDRTPAPETKPRKKKGWFASLFGGSDDEEEEKKAPAAAAAPAADFDDAAMTLRLREAEPSLSAWLAIVLDGVEEAGDELWRRLRFLLRSLDAPADEVDAFVDEFARWLERMEYHYIDEFRSELQYRLALALDMEDEEDERNRLFLKISDGLARTREQFSRQLNAIFSGHGELTEEFWENLEELFIMADLGYDASLALVERLRKRAADMGVVKTEDMRAVLRDEIEEIFRVPRKITAFNAPEVILFIGVNGVGKTTTIAKLAYRARMQGKKVMIAAADTFRAAAIEQLQVWAERVGALFHARAAGSDPASVAFEAMDRALAEQVDILFVDTAGRLQTKHNLMEELTKIRTVLGKKHPGAPHRTILALDATTGQNALSQAKLFKEAAGVDELILTKLDGTAKGGVAIAVAMQEHLPITYIGLGEKLEDLRPFNGDDYARALLGEGEIVGTGK